MVAEELLHDPTLTLLSNLVYVHRKQQHSKQKTATKSIKRGLKCRGYKCTNKLEKDTDKNKLLRADAHAHAQHTQQQQQQLQQQPQH